MNADCATATFGPPVDARPRVAAGKSAASGRGYLEAGLGEPAGAIREMAARMAGRQQVRIPPDVGLLGNRGNNRAAHWQGFSSVRARADFDAARNPRTASRFAARISKSPRSALLRGRAANGRRAKETRAARDAGNRSHRRCDHGLQPSQRDGSRRARRRRSDDGGRPRALLPGPAA